MLDGILKFIQTLLAKVIDGFKANNPWLFGFFGLILGSLMYIIENGQIWEVIPYTPAIEKITFWISWLLTLLVGSRTAPFLTTKKPTPSNIEDKKNKMAGN